MFQIFFLFQYISYFSMQAATGFHNPLLACPHLAFSCSLLQFAGTGYLAGDGAGCRYCGTCQIDLGFYMSHTSDKVTIGRGDTSLAFCQDTMYPPRQGPQVGVLTTAPASIKVFRSPSSMACI